jgi:hypothetical protein
VKLPCVSVVELALALAVGSLLVNGCAQTQTVRLRVVDGTTSKPMSGVSAQWREDSAYNMLTGHRHQTGPTQLPLSNEEGVILVRGVHNEWVSRFVVWHPGYATNYGIYSPDKLELAQRIKPSPLPQDRFILDDARYSVGPSNGYFEIPLQKQ